MECWHRGRSVRGVTSSDRIPEFNEGLTMTFTRRDILKATGSAAAAVMMSSPLHTLAAGADSADAGKKRRPRVAAIFTELRFRSHAFNILENFFDPYLFSGELVDPGCEVVSFFADQFPSNDMARDVSRKYKVPLYDSIAEALRVGGSELDVDAVLLIGEHGDYPYNKRGQKLYPRKRFFDEIVAVMKASDRFVPIFNDKHLSYRWDWAKEMVDTAQEHGIAMMAGSSVSLAQRVPALDLPKDARIREAVAVHGGGMEVYGFHGLELLQSFVEFRQGGESGISRIELLSGDAYQKAIRQGRWSQALADAAMQAERAMGARRQIRPDAAERRKAALNKPSPLPPAATQDHAICVTYKDGFEATVLRLGSDSGRWNFACQLEGEESPRATALFNGPWGNRCLFRALSHAIQHLFVTGEPAYPVERTLLVTGALDSAMQSFEQGGKPVATPHLEFGYQPQDFSAFRESGASWKFITPETPQPVKFLPGDARFMKG